MGVDVQRRSVFLVLALLGAAGTGAARASDPSADPTPSPSVRIERISTTYVFRSDGTATITQTTRVRVLDEFGRQIAGQPFVLFREASENAVLEDVRTIKPDGRTVAADSGPALEVTPPPTRQAPEYSDLKAKVKVAPSVSVGDAVEFTAVRTIDRPLKPGDFWAVHALAAGVPVDGEEVVLDVPADRDLLVRWDPDRAPAVETSGDRKLYRWKVEDPEAARLGRTSAAILFVASTLSPDGLASWFLGLQADDAAVTPEIRSVAERITAGLNTPREKLDALFAFVASSIRYVSISFGIGGYRPHAPTDVLHHQYGDCKDVDLLLRTLLAAVRIRSDPALVNVETGTPQPEVGAPSQFDHVLTVAYLDGDRVWMDATAGVAPVGVLNPSLRGRTALLATPEGARAVGIPSASTVPDRNAVEMTGALDAVGNLALATRITAEGSSAVTMRAMMVYAASAGRDALSRVWAALETGDGDAGVEKLERSDPTDLAVAPSVRFETTSKSWLGLTETEVEKTVPSLILRPRVASWGESVRDDAGVGERYLLGDPGECRESLSIAFDPSYDVTAPAPVRLERSFATYESSYDVTGHVLAVRRTLEVREPSAASERLRDLTSFRDVIRRDLEQKLVIRRTKAPDLRGLAATLDADALDAAGTRAIDDLDFELARDLFTTATAKSPDDKGAWSNLARAQMALGDLDGSVRSNRRALEIDPTDGYSRDNLAFTYLVLGDLENAEATFRKQLDIDPLDGRATHGLGTVSGELGKWNDAVENLERTAKIAPDDVAARIELVSALAKTGRGDDARKLATTLLRDALPPVPTLRLALALAADEIDLDLADAAADRVGKEAASACRGVSLDHVPDGYWVSVGTLTGALVVHGVTALRRGDPDRAVATLRSAYDIMPNPFAATWLARAYALHGDPATGLRFHALALRTSPSRSKPIELPEELRDYVAAEFEGDSDALNDRLDELGAEALELDRVEPSDGEFVVPENPGKSGAVFEVRVLVDENGVVEDARAVGGREPFVGAARADLRRVRFPPLGAREAPIKSVRVVKFLYLPNGEVRAFWRFETPSGRNAILRDLGSSVTLPGVFTP